MARGKKEALNLPRDQLNWLKAKNAAAIKAAVGIMSDEERATFLGSDLQNLRHPKDLATTVASWAAYQDDVETLKLTLQYPDEVALENSLMYAVEQGNFECCKVLLDYFLSQNIKGHDIAKHQLLGLDRLVYTAVARSDMKVLKLLFEHEASKCGELLDKPVHTCRFINLTLMDAVAAADPVRFLHQEAGQDPNNGLQEDNCDKLRPLHRAAVSGDLEAVKALLEVGAHIGARTVNGFGEARGNALHVMMGAYRKNVNEDVEMKLLDTARYLIEKGLSPTEPNIMDRKTPLQLAMKAGPGAEVFIRFLVVELGLDPNQFPASIDKHNRKAVEDALALKEELGEGAKITKKPKPDPWTVATKLDLDEWEMRSERCEMNTDYGMLIGPPNSRRHKSYHDSQASATLRDIAKRAQELSATLRCESDASNPWEPWWVNPEHHRALKLRGKIAFSQPFSKYVKDMLREALGCTKASMKDAEFEWLEDARDFGELFGFGDAQLPALEDVPAQPTHDQDRIAAIYKLFAIENSLLPFRIKFSGVVFPDFIGGLHSNGGIAGLVGTRVET